MSMEKTFTIPKEQEITHAGDVVIRRIDTIPETAKSIKGKPLALGEFSGHQHIAVAEKESTINFFEDENGVYLQVQGTAKVRHALENGAWTGEHHALVLPQGAYHVTIQRVLDPFSKTIGKVKD
jgi:hypothetical protein